MNISEHVQETGTQKIGIFILNFTFDLMRENEQKNEVLKENKMEEETRRQKDKKRERQKGRKFKDEIYCPTNLDVVRNGFIKLFCDFFFFCVLRRFKGKL